jgi:hypothetical protein
MFRTESEFLQFAFHHYDNPHLSSVTEFESDLKRFIYVNNLLNRGRLNQSDLKDRLIINHLVILGNCFTVPGSIKMLYFKIAKENIPLMETFLYYMGRIEKANTYLDFAILNILENYEN